MEIFNEAFLNWKSVDQQAYSFSVKIIIRIRVWTARAPAPNGSSFIENRMRMVSQYKSKSKGKNIVF